MTSEGQTLIQCVREILSSPETSCSLPPGLGPGQFRRHTDHGRSTQGRQPELAYASPGPPADMAVRRKRKKGEIKKRENRTERKKGEFELDPMEGVGEGYQQGH